MEKKDLAVKLAERITMLLPRNRDAIAGAILEGELALILTRYHEHSRATSTLAQLLRIAYGSQLYGSTPVTPAILSLDPFWDPSRSDRAFAKLCEEKQP
jgi:hypothetical protein